MIKGSVNVRGLNCRASLKNYVIHCRAIATIVDLSRFLIFLILRY